MPPIRTASTTPTTPTTSENESEVEVHGSSWVWSHGTIVSKGRWRCDHLCVPRHFVRTFSTKGTTHAATHLIKVHKLIKPGTADTDKAQISINAPRHFNATVLRRAITEWIVEVMITALGSYFV
jgi:hypothetical protein